jgi:hypothetical protein
VRSAVDSSVNLYYAATGPDGLGAGSGRIYAGQAGANFHEVFQHPASVQVSDIEVDTLHPTSVFVSFAPPYRIDRDCSTQAAQRIYRIRRQSTTPTAATVTAADITGSLPAGLCVNTLAIDPRPPLTVYAGTQHGVYRGRPHTIVRTFASETWSWAPYNDGMPRTDVRDLELHPSVDLMYAATYGRGAFEVFLTPRRVLPGRP